MNYSVCETQTSERKERNIQMMFGPLPPTSSVATMSFQHLHHPWDRGHDINGGYTQAGMPIDVHMHAWLWWQTGRSSKGLQEGYWTRNIECYIGCVVVGWPYLQTTAMDNTCNVVENRKCFGTCFANHNMRAIANLYCSPGVSILAKNSRMSWRHTNDIQPRSS